MSTTNKVRARDLGMLGEDQVVELVALLDVETCARLRGALLGRLADDLGGIEQAKAHVLAIMDSPAPAEPPPLS